MPKKQRLLVISLALAVAASMAFWRITQSDFITLDDPRYVTQNRHVQDGLTLQGMKWAFTTGHADNWHPLTWISHMVDVQLFGLQPGWHHLTNLIFHLANTILLFIVLHRMTNEIWQCAFVAAVFALHPLHVESVAWVAERKDVLSAFFWMLTLGAYVSYVGRPGLRRYMTLVLCFALGLMAKPMLVTLPFVLLLLDYWPLRRMEQKKVSPDSLKAASKRKKRRKGTQLAAAAAQPATPLWPLIRRLLAEKSPLFFLAGLSSVVTFLVQQHGGAVKSFEAYPLTTRLANASISYILYAAKTAWPTNLGVFYPHPGMRPLWQVVGSFVLIVAITALTVRGAKKRPYAPVGWLWYLGTLVPVIGVVQVGTQAMADRYTYIPLIGLFILIAWAVPELLKKWPRRKEALIALSTLCLLCLFITTWRQVGHWKDSISLYDHTLGITDHNALIHSDRGIAYASRGAYDRAIMDFTKVIEIDSKNWSAYINRGLAFSSLGKYAEAIADFDKAIEIDPGSAEGFNARGVAYNSLGKYAQAEADFDEAIEIDPHYAEAYNNRGVALDNLGKRDLSIGDYTRAIEINPTYATAYKNRAADYGILGSYSQAIADFNRAIELNPVYARAFYQRGAVYEALGKHDRAVEDIQTAARLGDEGAKRFLQSRGIGW
jgi:tetratricopeptide (TPR) repeat protein